MRGKKHLQTTLAIFLVALAPGSAHAGQKLDLRKMFEQGIPDSPFAAVVYGYADAMLEHGTDTYGPQKTGLFLSALDRKTLAPLENRPAAPAGIREGDRPGPAAGPLVGANPQLDQNLLRLLYFLKGLSGEDRYPRAADKALQWFLENAQSPQTGLLPWGEHLSWNVMTDAIASGHPQPVHEFARPGLLWERCFELAPEASEKFALGLWRSQIADHNAGAFNRHAPFDKSSPKPGLDFARHAGFYIRTWADAYAHTTDETFLEAIRVLLGRYEKKRHPKTALIELTAGSPRANSALSLSLAIDCDGAARRVPEPLRTRLHRFAAREDEVFCSLPHELKGKGGFAVSLDVATGWPDGPCTSLWDARYGAFTTAAVAVMCVSRYQNTGNICYRDLLVAAAEAYMDSLPGDAVDAWPMTFGHAITLELAAFGVTARKEFYDRAFRLAEITVEKFFDGSPLPRASLKTNHYESITGADTLVLALAELHLSVRHITAVRTPANTIDR
ncbi:MAG: hypothetical protein JSU94_06575 [Phycisphaerales bacterium]|nr:MAG: hypothetical protein JSU94_06575 [Phycisphaerales bacterium]